jgi:hypothetical protein
MMQGESSGGVALLDNIPEFINSWLTQSMSSKAETRRTAPSNERMLGSWWDGAVHGDDSRRA